MNWKRTFATGVIAIISIGFAGFFWIWAAPCALGGCAPLDDLAEFHAEGSELFDANGEPFARLATVNRRIVSLDSLPDYLPAAFLAIAPGMAQAAEPPCITSGEFSSLASFALPSALGGATKRCSTVLGPSSYMRSSGAQLIERYAAGKQQAWPQAEFEQRR